MSAIGTAVRTIRVPRRFVLRTAFTVAVTAGTAGALAPVLTRNPAARDNTGPERFAETYRGRDIQGAVTVMAPARGSARAIGARTAAAQQGIAVHIDGRALHVMRRADGSYLSTVNHYESFPTLLETARAAVDELGSAQLSDLSPHSI